MEDTHHLMLYNAEWTRRSASALSPIAAPHTADMIGDTVGRR